MAKNWKISPEGKKPIKCLFVARDKAHLSLYDLAILTTDFQFYQCEFRTNYDTLTSDMFLRLVKIFRPFQLTKDSDVMVTDTIGFFEPLFYYFKMLQNQMYFKLRQVKPIQIPKRIAQFHKSYCHRSKAAYFKMADINILWDKILKNQKCPWITEAEDAVLKDCQSAYAFRMKFLRLSIYYMLIKEHLYSQYLQQKAKKSKTV